MIKTGDRVTWVSSYTEKRGTVIADVPAGVSAKQYIPTSAKKSHSKIDMDKSKIDRMLVAVPAGKDGKITHYYAARKSLLKLVDDSEN